MSRSNLRLPSKLAVVSHILPPSPSGHAVVLERLLRGINSEDYCLISRESYDFREIAERRLPARYFTLRPEYQFRRPNRFGTAVVRIAVNQWLRIIARARSISRIVRQEKCAAILACTGDPYDLPAAYLASRCTGRPFLAYILDDYLFQWPPGAQRNLARRVEPYIIKGAAGIIVPNEFVRDEYRRRYNTNPTIIRNAHDFPAATDRVAAWASREGETRIVYTGAVYHAHYDAFSNLISAIKQLDKNVKLHLYTAQPRDILESKGISGPVIYHSHVPPAEVFDVQRRADILFLPLAFNSSITEVIKTSAPGKMGEYLASGRPILVHAPGDSFLSWYFRKHGCGVVVDEPDASQLAHSIRRLIEDAGLRSRLVEKAEECAVDFRREAVQQEFLRVIQAMA